MKCHKAKPKVITTTDKMKGKYPWEIMRNQSQSNKLSKARDNTGVQFVIGLSFASVWLREWHEFFFRPITERKKPNPMQYSGLLSILN